MTYSIRSIEGLPPAQLKNLVTEYAAADELWRTRLRFDADERFCLLLHSDELTDIWLLSWLSGQHTTLHDHGGSRAAIQVVQGELHELHVEPDGKVHEHRLTRRAPHLLGPGAIHDVVNTAGPDAASIHAYSPPLRAMTYYERERNGFRPTRTIATRHPEPA